MQDAPSCIPPLMDALHLQFSAVDLDQSLFQPFPSEVVFQSYVPCEVYEVPLVLRNNDMVSVGPWRLNGGRAKYSTGTQHSKFPAAAQHAQNNTSHLHFVRVWKSSHVVGILPMVLAVCWLVLTQRSSSSRCFSSGELCIDGILSAAQFFPSFIVLPLESLALGSC